jgi:predicted dithiol-disulfide oxidoreductase (DUF899 family)
MVNHETIPHPPIVSHEAWVAARRAHLVHEKEMTKKLDALRAERRRLPMEKVEQRYTFEGPTGKLSLMDLFEGRRQLIIYHFMFDPAWDKGCPGCTGLVNAIGDLSMLAKRDTTFAMVSRAPLAKLENYKDEKGWNIKWYSSFDSDFNYDFHATQDKSKAPLEYNYQDEAALRRRHDESFFQKGEQHGTSVFFRMDNDIYHTYSAYARGCESLTDAYDLLDITPYGRQESFEDSPAGWPQKPTYG